MTFLYLLNAFVHFRYKVRQDLAAAGNTRAYYWFLLQIVFVIFGSFAAIAIAFTVHVGGFIAGVILTNS